MEIFVWKPKHEERTLGKKPKTAYVLDMFLSNRSLSIPEKLRVLEEKEAQLLVSYGSKEYANAAQQPNRSGVKAREVTRE
ncbi:hypothetical protein E4U14_003989 [Claviceps sp. LM454 group G7]|nr:hypothetical protein E4U14_003989 [Claviceps sp. LM454 group G7]